MTNELWQQLIDKIPDSVTFVWFVFAYILYGTLEVVLVLVLIYFGFKGFFKWVV